MGVSGERGRVCAGAVGVGCRAALLVVASLLLVVDEVRWGGSVRRAWASSMLMWRRVVQAVLCGLAGAHPLLLRGLALLHVSLLLRAVHPPVVVCARAALHAVETARASGAREVLWWR